MQRDVGDIIDRWSIAKLKVERIGTQSTLEEYTAFQTEYESILKAVPSVEEYAKIILDINSFIWQLEAGLKGGKDGLPNQNYLGDPVNKEQLARIGETTILIRNFNHLRVKIKNLINKNAGTGFQDIKQDHLSS